MVERLLTGRRALVTGASSGIGAAIARQLAEYGADLVIAARRRDKLDRLAMSIRQGYGVTVDVIDLDLSHPGADDALWNIATVNGRPIDILINNAGFGIMRPFEEIDGEYWLNMLQVNLNNLVALSHHFVRDRLKRSDTRKAHLLNVSSTAAYQEVIPFFAGYAASKTFVLAFTEALHYELKGRPITVTCVCPGSTETEFHTVAGGGEYGGLADLTKLTPEEVAFASVKAMLKGKKTVIPGFLNKIVSMSARFLPRFITARLAVLLLKLPRRGQLKHFTPKPQTFE